MSRVKAFSEDLDRNRKLISTRFPEQLIRRLYPESTSRDFAAVSVALSPISLQLTEVTLELSLEGLPFDPEMLKSALTTLHLRRCEEIKTRLNENAKTALDWYHRSLTSESEKKHLYSMETVKVYSLLASSPMTDSETRRRLLEAARLLEVAPADVQRLVEPQTSVQVQPEEPF